jgi:release factor glutamine methyltransferase
VQSALNAAARAIGPAGEAPAADARRIVAHVLDRDAAWIIAHASERIEAVALARVEALAARRASGVPLAYIVGSAWFYGREFLVSPDVLVPRPETEHLVEAALDDLRTRVTRFTHPRACDVGTGSGAIALTLAAEIASVEVIACDVSERALSIARQNAARLALEGRVRFVAGDLAEPLGPLAPFECVVANLPYVPSGEVPQRPNPVGFEPRLALDGGHDGLGLYRRLVSGLPRLLTPGGCAFLEAAPGTIERLTALAQSLPGAHVEVGEDYAGLERWLSVTLP